MILTGITLIDRHETETSVLEVYRGPDGVPLRLVAIKGGRPSAASAIWSNRQWVAVHQVYDFQENPREALERIFKVTIQILGWEHVT